MEAEGLAPRLPTIEASMNCSSTDASCAIMAGPHRYRVSLTCCPSASGSPSRILPRSISVLPAILSMRKSMKKPRKHKPPGQLFYLYSTDIMLFDAYRPLCLGLLYVLAFRQVDGQHAVLDLGVDLLHIDILRQQHCLLELCV